MAAGIHVADVECMEALPNGFLIKFSAHPVFGHYLAYVHIPVDFEHMDDVDEFLGIHGGITFGPIDFMLNGINYKVFGCDYAHVGDGSDTIEFQEYLQKKNVFGSKIGDYPIDTVWTLPAVKEDVRSSVMEFLSRYNQNDDPDEE